MPCVFDRSRFKTSPGGADHDGMGGGGGASTPETTQQQQHQQFLGDTTAAIPLFGHIELGNEPLPDGVSGDHLRAFEDLYKKHCEVRPALSVLTAFGL